MQQVAVFVDAGYLCMAGGALVAGQPINRRSIRLEVEHLLPAIIEQARQLAQDRPLLRVYWYDGCPNGTRKSAEHNLIEIQPDVKLRLGSISREGRQKGVDTSLVLDLVELAQNRAISDAVILGGDEDLRAGMIRAQALGVRVHLLGVDGSGPNQSHEMRAEADRTVTWGADQIAPFITIQPEEMASAPGAESAEEAEAEPWIIQAAQEAAKRANLHDVQIYWTRVNEKGLPAEIDARLLASARSVIGRDLNTEEKRALRAHHARALRQRITEERSEA